MTTGAAADCGAAKCRIDRCGHKVWDYVHFIAGVYSDHGSAEARSFAVHMLSNIHLMVPCQRCQNHAEANASKFGLKDKLNAAVAKPMAPGAEGSMFHVMWAFHNFVNEYLGKPALPLANALEAFEVCAVKQGEMCSLEGPSCDDVEGAPQPMAQTILGGGSAWKAVAAGLGIVAVAGATAFAVKRARDKRTSPARSRFM